MSDIDSALAGMVWVEKYRPNLIEDCILPELTKETFKDFVKTGSFPNLLLTGTAGTGKTTLAKALLHELDYEYILINASDERNIETVRTTIKNFSSTNSLYGKKKAIILDEADGLNPQSAQPALRAAMEEFHYVRFILTCNFKNKLIEPIHSRCSVYDFSVTKKEKQELMIQFMKRLTQILQKENVAFDVKALANIVKKHFPDNRRILNQLQGAAQSGKISSENTSETVSDIDYLIAGIKEKDYKKCRQWIETNSDDVEVQQFLKILKDKMYDLVTPESIGQLIKTTYDYSLGAAFITIPETVISSCIVELMSFCEFKD